LNEAFELALDTARSRELAVVPIVAPAKVNIVISRSRFESLCTERGKRPTSLPIYPSTRQRVSA
jgi:hypothetical protein